MWPRSATESTGGEERRASQPGKRTPKERRKQSALKPEENAFQKPNRAATAPRLLAAEGTWGGQEIKMLKKLLSGNLRFSMQEEAGAREQKGPGEGAEGLKELLGEGEQALRTEDLRRVCEGLRMCDGRDRRREAHGVTSGGPRSRVHKDRGGHSELQINSQAGATRGLN